MKTLFIKNKMGRIVQVTQAQAKFMVVNDNAEIVDAPVKEEAPVIKEDLTKLNKIQLTNIATEMGIKFEATTTKEELITFINEKR